MPTLMPKSLIPESWHIQHKQTLVNGAGEACQDPIGLSIYANLLGIMIKHTVVFKQLCLNVCSHSGTSQYTYFQLVEAKHVVPNLAVCIHKPVYAIC